MEGLNNTEQIAGVRVGTGDFAGQSVAVEKATKTQRIVSRLLKRDLSEYVNEHRGAGLSWQAIAERMREDTGGAVDLSRETIRIWATNGFVAAPRETGA